jgi:glycosyltransferase involved in cell wall biosynthesis
VPIARLLRKKTIWWDAGYSLPKRTFKRKLIDNVVKPFVKLTNGQMAYSTLAKNYISKYMGANNAFLNLNTINTSYFDSISNEIYESLDLYKYNPASTNLLYVGVVEQRKKVKELIDITIRLNNVNKKRVFILTIIGGGVQVEELRKYTFNNKNINLLGPIYDKEVLKQHYFKNDLFILPGDGGLAILQSLLFGLPVLSILGADGTELDYIKDKSYLANSISDIEDTLTKTMNIDRKKIIQDLPDIRHEDWKQTLIKFIKTL